MCVFLCEICSSVIDIYRPKHKTKKINRQTDRLDSIDCYSKRLNGISERTGYEKKVSEYSFTKHAHYDLPCAPIVLLVEKFGPDWYCFSLKRFGVVGVVPADEVCGCAMCIG